MDEFSPKVALEYTLTLWIMTYVSAAKGYRSGGFNVVATDQEFYSYDQEELWSYEFSVKSAFMDNRLTLNGSVFYMDISNMQVAQTLQQAFHF